MSSKSSQIKWNPFSPEFHNNPYPTYHRLRELEPTRRSEQFGGSWLLTRYADVKQILRDRRVKVQNKSQRIQSKESFLKPGQTVDDLVQMTAKSLTYMDPPDHTRIKNLLGKGFLPQSMEKLRPQIQAIVNSLLIKAFEKGEMDLISDLAVPLPVYVIASMLGVPEADRHLLHEWSIVLSRLLDSFISLEEYVRINTAVNHFRDYFFNLIRQRREHPRDDLISTFIAAQEQTDRLSETELWVACTLLFMTGEETTVNAIGNGVLALLNHPQQFEWLRQNPQLVPQALEELLRFDSPVQFTARIADEEITIGSAKINPGEEIFLCIGAANRDPEHFSEPDTLNFNRSSNPHLAFSDGIHHCLGATLARIQGQIAITTLLQLEDLSLSTPQLTWRKNVTLRGLTSLPLTFTSTNLSID